MSGWVGGLVGFRKPYFGCSGVRCQFMLKMLPWFGVVFRSPQSSNVDIENILSTFN